MLIDIEARNILLLIPFEATIYHLIEVTVKFTISHQGGFLLYLFVVVYDFININIILIICLVADDKLTGDSGHNVT